MMSSCVSVPKVNEAEGQKPVRSWWQWCKKPVAIERDCSNYRGPQRRVRINNVDLLVAGSADGTKVLFMDAHWLRNGSLTPLLMSSPIVSYANNAAYEAIVGYLKEKSVTVLKVQPLGDAYTTAGYLLELDRDGYREFLTLPAK